VRGDSRLEENISAEEEEKEKNARISREDENPRGAESAQAPKNQG